MRLCPEWFIHETVRRELDRARRYGRPVSFALVGVDDPHPERSFAALTASVMQVVRGSDLVGLVGNRLAIVLPETDLDAAALTAERVVRMCETVAPSTLGPSLRLHAGVASYRPDSGYTPEAMLYEAESALQLAERGGAGPVAVFDAV